jgi:mannose-6-phosphate isomerase-like protein (cupin superfamily)
MKISFKHQAIESKNNEACMVIKHDFNDDTISCALVKISGRYPEIGRVTNLKCKEIIYVQSGNGKVVVNEKEYLLNAGDSVLIEAGEKLYWEGNMELFVACQPAFNSNQKQMVD